MPLYSEFHPKIPPPLLFIDIANHSRTSSPVTPPQNKLGPPSWSSSFQVTSLQKPSYFPPESLLLPPKMRLHESLLPPKMRLHKSLLIFLRRALRPPQVGFHPRFHPHLQKIRVDTSSLNLRHRRLDLLLALLSPPCSPLSSSLLPLLLTLLSPTHPCAV